MAGTVLVAGCRGDRSPASRPADHNGITAGSSTRPATGPAQPPLSTGRLLDPSRPQSSVGVGSMPMNVVLSRDGKYAISTGSGYREELCATRVTDGTRAGHIEYRSTPKDKANGLYFGLTVAPDGTIYAAGGASGDVAVVTVGADGSLEQEREIHTGDHDFPAGVAIDNDGQLYVTHNDPSHPKGTPFDAPASVSVHDAATGKELGRHVFPDDLGLSNFPLAVTVNADGSRLYVGSQRDDAVYVLDASDPAAIKLHATLATGSHPVALLLNKAQTRLFVANAHSDTVSVVDTATDKVLHTILVRPQVAKDLAGATPNGLALSANEKMLYVTLGDMNAVAVIDLADRNGPELEGYIPTGWYPTAVAVSGKTLLVTNAKGDVSRVPHDFKTNARTVASPLTLYEGTLWRLPIPSKAELADLTERVLTNARLTPELLTAHNPLRAINRESGKIKHVLYVVKENRTYDHILGDMPQGNGDPARCLFPREVTPNLHALAERFVLLDNFYDSGEVSGDGWTWSTQAQANEYTIRNVPYQYSGRGRIFDYEGQNNGYPTGGFPAKGPDGKPLSEDPRFKDGGKAINDVAQAPGGHLWDLAIKAGLSYRNYGFFVGSGVTEKGKVVIPDNYPASTGLQPGGHDLGGVTDLDFRRFDLNYPDGDAPARHAAERNDAAFLWQKQSYGKGGAKSRFAEWKREFDLMLAKDPTGGAVPAFMTLRLGTDHTMGANPGVPTPRCFVADNDYAIGQLVEAVSRSPIWQNSAIVVIEDDAQNGPDHVDAHRSTCYVVSPYVKRGTIDHTFQNTVSAIRTVECLLGLPAMCQYDAASGVIGGWDDAPRNAEPYAAILPPAAIMRERNASTNAVAPVSPEQPNDPSAAPASRPGTMPVAPTRPAKPSKKRRADDRPMKTKDDMALASMAMDFAKADHAPADVLNRVIWKTVKGVEAEMPPTPHVIAAAGQGAGDDDDDD